MNRCPDARALLPAYVENELSAVEAMRVQGHLDICSACRREEMAFRASLGALQAAPKPVHRDLYAGLSARLDQIERRPAAPRLQLRWAGGVAALLLTVGVGATIATKTFAPGVNHAASTVSSNSLANRGAATRIVPAVPAPQGESGGPQIVQKDDPAEGSMPEQTPIEDTKPEMVTENVQEDTPPSIAHEGTPRSGERKPRQRTIRARDESWASVDFRKVRDKHGRSVEDIVEELKKYHSASSGNVASAASSSNPVEPGPEVQEDVAIPVRVNDPAMPDVAMILAEREKKEAVGEKIVKSSRAEGFDKAGRLSLIRLNAEAAPRPESKGHLRKDKLDEEG